LCFVLIKKHNCLPYLFILLVGLLLSLRIFKEKSLYAEEIMCLTKN